MFAVSVVAGTCRIEEDACARVAVGKRHTCLDGCVIPLIILALRRVLYHRCALGHALAGSAVVAEVVEMVDGVWGREGVWWRHGGAAHATRILALKVRWAHAVAVVV